MEKEKILFKIRDYNNELEKVLEKKSFSESCKNLLLSMLYKIETSYSDYEKVKVETLNKNDYLETIILNILQSCSIIHLIKPGMEDEKILKEKHVKCYINSEKNEIFTYQNERSLLQGILEIGEKEKKYSVNEKFLKQPVNDFLHYGKLTEMLEVLTDFNGWSWNISKDDINGQEAKICYMNLIYVLGIETAIKLENEDNVIQYILKKLVDTYGEEIAIEFFKSLIQNILKIYARKDNQYLSELKAKQKETEEELERIKNKSKYLENLTEEKMKINDKIGKIDILLNNTKLLREKYIETNKNLPNEKKHFSVSTYAETIEKERNKFLEKRNEINKLFKPDEFIKKRESIEEKSIFFKEIKLDELGNNECLEKLQLIFLKLFSIKIQKCIDKKELSKLIYELRYYFIHLNERNLFNNQHEEHIKIKREIIGKAIKIKLCSNLSKEQKNTEDILINIFDSKIVNLDKVEILVKKENEVINLEIYDEKILEDTIELQGVDWKEKNKKRRKIFI